MGLQMTGLSSEDIADSLEYLGYDPEDCPFNLLRIAVNDIEQFELGLRLIKTFGEIMEN